MKEFLNEIEVRYQSLGYRTEWVSRDELEIRNDLNQVARIRVALKSVRNKQGEVIIEFLHNTEDSPEFIQQIMAEYETKLGRDLEYLQ